MVASSSAAFSGRTFASPMPKRILAADSARFEWRPHTLLHGVIGAIEGAARDVAPRTITAVIEGLRLGASRLHIGRQSGGYRDNSNLLQDASMALLSLPLPPPQHYCSTVVPILLTS